MKYLLLAIFLLFSTSVTAHEEQFSQLLGAPSDWIKFTLNNKNYMTLKKPIFTNNSEATGKEFATYIIQDLPDSDIINAPKSQSVGIQVNCKARVYQVQGTYFFSKQMGNGMPAGTTELEYFQRKINKGSAIDKVMKMFC
jgi:hypothetical protein